VLPQNKADATRMLRVKMGVGMAQLWLPSTVCHATLDKVTMAESAPLAAHGGNPPESLGSVLPVLI
jgi:hypothetical protein